VVGSCEAASYLAALALTWFIGQGEPGLVPVGGILVEHALGDGLIDCGTVGCRRFAAAVASPAVMAVRRRFIMVRTRGAVIAVHFGALN